MQKLPTIKEIALRLNVSISTVSRALKDHPRIGLATRMRVKQLAKELDYEPNNQAIQFRKKRTAVIGVVLPYIREDFFSDVISGIEIAATQHEYTILFGQSFDNYDREKKVVETMKKQRVDGIIISLAKETVRYDHLQGLKKYGIPVVYIDRVPALSNVNKVYCDIYNGTIEMISWLFDRGYKRIGLVNGPREMQACKERLKGYMDGISRRKMKVNMQYVENTDFSRESTYNAVEKLISLKTPPNAIVTFNDYVHLDVVQFAHAHNIRINKDILFLSYANRPITSHITHPPLGSVEQYPFLQGDRAMQMMMKILDKEEVNDNGEEIYFTEQVPSRLVMHPMSAAM